MKQNAAPFFRRLAAALLCCFIGAAAFAQDESRKPAPLDKDRQAIVQQVLDKIIADIKGLKGQYPELEHFGDAPWFTRGPGEFRYDYKMKSPSPGNDNSTAKALPGGCGMYFSLAALYTPPSKWSDYYRGKSFGGDRAGIGHDFSITTDNPKLEAAVSQAVDHELSGPFEELAADYVLLKNNVKQDTGAIIESLASPDENVRYSATRALAARKLAPAELAAIRGGYTQGRFPTTFGFYYLLQCLRSQDDAHLPDFCLAMAKLEIRVENEGTDTFTPTPAVTGPESNSRIARSCLLEIFAGKDVEADARFAPAALEILTNDQVLRDRQQALDYFSKLPAGKREEGIAAGLGNSYRSVQAQAAEIAGNLKVPGVEKALAALLASPSLMVRTAARNAAVKLGLQGIDLDPKRPLPASVAHIADTLWQEGLLEEDVVKACSKPDTRAFNPIMPKPEHWALPEGVVAVDEDVRDEKGKPVPNTHHDYYVELKDPWRMSAMDAPSVKRRAAQFAVGIRKDWTADTELDATGQFLIAAAMKLGDPATAQTAYERLCDMYSTDDDILFDGVEVLGWERLEEGLSFYEQARDDDALKAFAAVTRLEKQSRPFTYLANFIKLARQVSADIDRRKKENAGNNRPPLPAGKDERIKAMIAQFENVNSESEVRTINALKGEGNDAVEPLLQCMLHDGRLTRMVEENMDHGERPDRWVAPVRSVAFQALNGMFGGNFPTMDDYMALERGDPAVLEKLAAEVRKARDAKKN